MKTKIENVPVVCFLCLLLGACVAVPSSEVSYRDDKVTIIGHTVFIYPWFPDTYSYSVLRVSGHDYSGIRGALPCYIEIPERHSILFVTGKAGQAIVHLVELSTQKETHFPAYDSDIGSCILPQKETTDQWFEKVESVKDYTLTIVAGTFNHRRYKHVIDLKASRYVKQECEYYDSLEKQMKHVVYDGGIRPKS